MGKSSCMSNSFSSLLIQSVCMFNMLALFFCMNRIGRNSMKDFLAASAAGGNGTVFVQFTAWEKRVSHSSMQWFTPKREQISQGRKWYPLPLFHGSFAVFFTIFKVILAQSSSARNFQSLTLLFISQIYSKFSVISIPSLCLLIQDPEFNKLQL